MSHIPQVFAGELFLGFGSLGRGKKKIPKGGGGGGECENVTVCGVSPNESFFLDPPGMTVLRITCCQYHCVGAVNSPSQSL